MTKKKAPTALERARQDADFWRKAHDRVSRQLELVLRLQERQAGPVAKPKAPRAPEDVEAAAVDRAQRAALDRAVKQRTAFIANAKAGLMKEGADAVAAEREAARLWDQANDSHPEGG